MNSLSWMIYLADVADGVGTLLPFSAGVAFVATGIAVGIHFSTLAEEVKESHHSDQRHAASEAWRKAAHLRSTMGMKWGTSLFAVFSALAIVIPTSTTIYAIAASEMGEEVLNSKTAGKAMKALDAWLDRQIARKES